MSAYEAFAEVYDHFMQDAPYAQWLDLLSRKYPLASLDVADVGCGTGTLTLALAEVSRSCLGVDVSTEMLAEAQQQAVAHKARVRWLCQDIRELRLPGTVDLVVSTCDVINYLLSPADVQQAFAAISQALRPGAIFAFDVLGPRRLRTLQNGYWHQVDDEAVLLHETSVTGNRIDHDVHAFVLAEAGLYERIEEQHTQMYYETSALAEWLAGSGMCLREVLPDFGASDLEQADRIVYFAEKVSSP